MATKKKKKSKKASEFWGTHKTSRGNEPLKRRRKVATRIVGPKHDAGSRSIQKAAHKFFKAKAAASNADVAAHMAAANRRGFPSSSDSVAHHMSTANKRGFGAVGFVPKKTRKKSKKKVAKKAKKSTYVRGRHHGIGSPNGGGRTAPSKKKKSSRKASPSKGRSVTAAELISGARNRVTRSRTGSLKVWTCIGKIRSGCGGGKKGGHVIG